MTGIYRERGGRAVTPSRSIQREDLDLEGGAATGVTGPELPPDIFSGGENILRTNSPPGENVLG